MNYFSLCKSGTNFKQGKIQEKTKTETACLHDSMLIAALFTIAKGWK